MFRQYELYTKQDIYNLLNVPLEIQGGAWDTGYRKYNNAVYIFCNIGVAGRTGHNYNNHWEENKLVWFAKTNTHVNQNQIVELLAGTIPVHIFTREDNRVAFVYQGQGIQVRHVNSTPVEIVWEII